jgi:hypothetical protein
MFQRLRLRLQDKRYRRSAQKHEIWRLKQRQRKETGRLEIYHQGFNARMSGKPCEPPVRPPTRDWHPEDEPFYAMRREAWTEGWEAADQEVR